MADADAIFIVRMIEAELRAPQNVSKMTRPPPPVIVEISLDSNHHFLPLPPTKKLDVDEEESDTDEEDEAEEELQVQTSQKGIKGVLSGLLAKKKKKPAKGTLARGSGRGAAAAAAADSLLDGGSDFLRQPRFASGQLFVSSIVTSLAVNTYYNPTLAELIVAMIDAQIVMLEVGPGWHEECFYDYFMYVLNKRELLAIGIYRKTSVVSTDTKKKTLKGGRRKQGAKTNSHIKLIPDHYVYSSPAAKDTVLTSQDAVLCIMKKDWTGTPQRYGPQLRDYGAMPQGQFGQSNMTNSLVHGASPQQSFMGTQSTELSTTGNAVRSPGHQVVAIADENQSPQTSGYLAVPQQQPGAPNWTMVREQAGSVAVGGPQPLPPPPGVKEPLPLSAPTLPGIPKGVSRIG